MKPCTACNGSGWSIETRNGYRSGIACPVCYGITRLPETDEERAQVRRARSTYARSIADQAFTRLREKDAQDATLDSPLARRARPPAAHRARRARAGRAES